MWWSGQLNYVWWKKPSWIFSKLLQDWIKDPEVQRSRTEAFENLNNLLHTYFYIALEASSHFVLENILMNKKTIFSTIQWIRQLILTVITYEIITNFSLTTRFWTPLRFFNSKFSFNKRRVHVFEDFTSIFFD